MRFVPQVVGRLVDGAAGPLFRAPQRIDQPAFAVDFRKARSAIKAGDTINGLHGFFLPDFPQRSASPTAAPGRFGKVNPPSPACSSFLNRIDGGSGEIWSSVA